MKNLASIFWHEGLFLRPHHLQQQERVNVDRLGMHLDVLNRFHWGVAALEIERGALKNQAVEVSRCAMVFPGGEIAVVPENARLDPRSFADHLPTAGQPLDVYLGLPRIRPTEPNYADPATGGDGMVRYLTRTREINDEVSGERTATVEFAIANLKILFGDEDLGALECVKVAEIVQRGPDQFEVSTSFIPPCLRIDAVPELMRLCSRVRDGLSATARDLHGLKRERGEVDARFQLALMSVNSYLGPVNHLMASGNAHPFHFYTLLTGLVSELSSFSSDAEAWDVTPYLHENPGPAFRDTADKIDKYLNFVFPKKFIEVPLTWVEAEGCYACTLSDDHFDESFRYCLAFAGDDPPEAIRAEVHGKAKMGAPERIPTLRNLALRGVAFKPLDGPPSEIPRRPAAYFHVDPIGPEWEKIREDKQLQVYLPSAAGLAVSLFVIRSS